MRNERVEPEKQILRLALHDTQSTVQQDKIENDIAAWGIERKNNDS